MQMAVSTRDACINHAALRLIIAGFAPGFPVYCFRLASSPTYTDLDFLDNFPDINGDTLREVR